jgi:hypothetical protein
MSSKFKKFITATGAAAILATGSLAVAPRPASADTTSTILTAAAVVGGLVVLNNIENKNRAARWDNDHAYYGNGYYGNGGYGRDDHRSDRRDGGRRR